MLSLSAFAGAFLLLAHGAVKGGQRRRALFFVFIGLLTFGLAGHFFGSAGLWSGLTLVIRDLGLGLLLGAGYMAWHKNKHHVFLLPGLVALGLAGTLYLTGVSVNYATDKISSNKGQQQQPKAAGQFLLELGPDDNIAELFNVLKTHKARFEKAFPSITLAEDEDLAQYYIVFASSKEIPALMKKLLADKENVDHVDWNYKVQLDPMESKATEINRGGAKFFANDPMLKDQWGFDKTNGDDLHKALTKITPKRKAIVAIVDTGVDGRHEDIRDVFESSPGDQDGNGHGSHCAGIAGAATNNKTGVASYNLNGKFVTIRGYKALTDDGYGTVESVSQAIIDAAKGGADVISMSLGGYSPTPPKAEVDAVKFAIKKGCIVLCAAGNSNEDAKLHAPANIPGVIVVSALNEGMNKARFSNTNTSLAMPIAAPGVSILSLKTGGGYVSLSGTSMACPMVAGLVGVMRSMNPDLDTKGAYEILHKTGVQISDSDRVGHAINAITALEATVAGR
jgi:thermitase